MNTWTVTHKRKDSFYNKELHALPDQQHPSVCRLMQFKFKTNWFLISQTGISNDLQLVITDNEKIPWEKNARKVWLGHISGQVWLYNDSMHHLPHESRIAFMGFQSITKTKSFGWTSLVNSELKSCFSHHEIPHWMKITVYIYISLRHHLQRQPMTCRPIPAPSSSLQFNLASWIQATHPVLSCVHIVSYFLFIYTAIYKVALPTCPSLNLDMALTTLNVTLSCGPNMVFSYIMVSRYHTNFPLLTVMQTHLHVLFLHQLFPHKCILWPCSILCSAIMDYLIGRIVI